MGDLQENPLLFETFRERNEEQRQKERERNIGEEEGRGSRKREGDCCVKFCTPLVGVLMLKQFEIGKSSELV